VTAQTFNVSGALVQDRRKRRMAVLSYRKLVVALVATAALVPVTVPVLGTAPAWADTCSTPKTDTITTTQGQRVWIPSSRSAGPFQWGGSQQISTANGDLNATTDSHSNTVGGSGGVNLAVWSASGKYDRQWGKSTTVTRSYTRTFTTNSGDVSREIQWRWRLYMKGYMFKATRTVTYPVPCAVTKRWVTKQLIVPATGTDFSFALEKYSNKGKFLKADGTPFRP
jgi:hypothetical protein